MKLEVCSSKSKRELAATVASWRLRLSLKRGRSKGGRRRRVELARAYFSNLIITSQITLSPKKKTKKNKQAMKCTRRFRIPPIARSYTRLATMEPCRSSRRMVRKDDIVISSMYTYMYFFGFGGSRLFVLRVSFSAFAAAATDPPSPPTN